MQRRECAIAGAKTYTAALLIAFSTWVLLIIALTHGQKIAPYAIVKSFGIGAYLVVPPAALFGAITGFELYRIAAGSVDWRPAPWWAWVLGVVLLQWLVFPLFLQERHRKTVIAEARGPSWQLPIFYFIIHVFISLAQITVGWTNLSRQFIWIQMVTVFITLLIADCVLVNHIAVLRDQGRLAPPQTHVFQFTLGTMLAMVLCAGSWVTGLVLIFGSR